MSSDIEREILAYIEDHNITDLVKKCLVELCINRPANPALFLRDYFENLQSKQALIAKQEVALPDTEENATCSAKTIVSKTKTMTDLSKGFANIVSPSNLNENQPSDLFDGRFSANFLPGEVITQYGDDGIPFYTIERGEVEVYLNDELVTTLKEGNSFGELDMIYGTAVKAKTPVKLWGIDRPSYNRILIERILSKRASMESRQPRSS